MILSEAESSLVPESSSGSVVFLEEEEDCERLNMNGKNRDMSLFRIILSKREEISEISASEAIENLNEKKKKIFNQREKVEVLE